MPVVTGMGIVSSIGNGTELFTRALKDGACGVAKQRLGEGETAFEYLEAAIRKFSFSDQINNIGIGREEFSQKVIKTCRRYPDTIKMDIAAAFEAFFMCGILENDISPERRAVITGGSNFNCQSQFQQYKKSLEHLNFVSPSYALNFMDTDLTGLLSELFMIHGEGFSVGGASASGNVAIIKAAQMIENGEADWCMVEGPVSGLSCVELMSMLNLGAMGGKVFLDKPDKACRPFDVQHEGFILGQAAACLIIESEETARFRGTEILAEIAGKSFQLHGSRLSDASQEYERKVMESAWRSSELDLSELSYINAHGTSTPMGDELELNAISQFCQDRLPQIYINSTKSLTGHCLFSAGIVEAIACILQMRNGFLHPNRNLCRPILEGFRFCGKTAVNTEIQAALSNSFGFGGINTSIVIRNPGIL